MKRFKTFFVLLIFMGLISSCKKPLFQDPIFPEPVHFEYLSSEFSIDKMGLEAFNWSNYVHQNPDPRISNNNRNFWIRLELNDSFYSNDWLSDFFGLDSYTLYYLKDKKVLSQQTSGWFFTDVQKESAVKSIKLKHDILKQSDTLLVYCETQTSLVVSLGLETQALRNQRIAKQNLNLGLSTGLLLAMIGFSFFFYSLTRERSYFYFSLYTTVAFIMVYYGKGWLNIILGDGAVYVNHYIFQLFVPLNLSLGTLFIYHFLQLHFKRSGRVIFRIILYSCLGAMLVYWLFPAYLVYIFNNYLLAIVLLVYLIGFIYYSFINSGGIVLLLSWSSLFIFAITNSISNLNASSHFPLLNNSLVIGYFVQSGLLFFVIVRSVRERYLLDISKKAQLEEQNQLNLEKQVRVDRQLQNNRTSLEVAHRGLLKTKKALLESQNALVANERIAGVGRMASGTAHEISTPIGNVKLTLSYIDSLWLEIEKKHGPFKESENMKSSMEIVQNNVERVTKTLKILRQLSSNLRSTEREIFYLKNAILNSLKEHDDSIDELSLQVDFQSHRCPYKLYSLEPLFYLIFSNLIKNTIKHGLHPDVNKRQVQIKVSVENESLNIFFENNGPHIKLVNLEKIFDPFFSTSKENGGMGMGLNLVYSIVTFQLGGKISVQNTGKDYGVRFHIQLPDILISDMQIGLFPEEDETKE